MVHYSTLGREAVSTAAPLLRKGLDWIGLDWICGSLLVSSGWCFCFFLAGRRIPELWSCRGN
jgi:hypothetical protein